MSADRELQAEVESRLRPHGEALGSDLPAYRNHVVRVLLLCDGLAARGADDGGERPSGRAEFLAAGVYHDLGIWTAGTFDYLEPSIALARAALEDEGRSDLVPLVTAMIDQHHKIRRAAAPGTPVETFRRADSIDVMFGLRRFGLPFGEYRRIARLYPDRGFHRRLVALTVARAREHPASPLPMLRW